jgi:hypothetical protein
MTDGTYLEGRWNGLLAAADVADVRAGHEERIADQATDPSIAIEYRAGGDALRLLAKHLRASVDTERRLHEPEESHDNG